MIEPDTIKLLRECDAGIKMGVKSIDDVLDRVKNSDLQQLLNACKDEHDKLDKELQQLLDQYGDEGKDPKFMAEQMAKIKTEMKLQMHETDHAIVAQSICRPAKCLDICIIDISSQRCRRFRNVSFR